MTTLLKREKPLPSDRHLIPRFRFAADLRPGSVIVHTRDAVSNRPTAITIVKDVEGCPSTRRGIRNFHVNGNQCYSGITRLDVYDR